MFAGGFCPSSPARLRSSHAGRTNTPAPADPATFPATPARRAASSFERPSKIVSDGPASRKILSMSSEKSERLADAVSRPCEAQRAILGEKIRPAAEPVDQPVVPGAAAQRHADEGGLEQDGDRSAPLVGRRRDPVPATTSAHPVRPREFLIGLRGPSGSTISLAIAVHNLSGGREQVHGLRHVDRTHMLVAPVLLGRDPPGPSGRRRTCPR